MLCALLGLAGISGFAKEASAATGSFEIGAASYSVNEGAGKVDVLVKRVGGSTGAATVRIRTLSQTATYDADYASFSWTTLSFAAGETQKVKSIGIVDDSVVEEDETFQVLLAYPTSGTSLGTTTSSTVTIVDNDSRGSFELDAASYSVDEGAGKVDVVIKRVGGSSGAATVQIRTTSQTATFNDDYASFSWTTLSFADGETQKVKSIGIVDDLVVEEDETFQVVLANPTGGATLGATTSTTVTIVDNDSHGSFEFGAPSYSVDEGAGKVDVVIKRVGGSSGAATVRIRTSSQTATYDADYASFSWTTLNFADGETQKVKSIGIVDDSVVEEDETFLVTLANPTGGAGLGAIISSTVTIVDNDENTPVQDITPPNVAVTSPTNNATVTSEQTVTIVVSASDNMAVTKVAFFLDGALIGTDTTNTYSVAIPVTSSDNGTRNITAVAYDEAGNSAQSSPVALNVNIPKASTEPGSFEFGAASYSVGEGDGKVDILIKRVGGSYGAATVQIRTSSQTATYDADYASFSWTTLSFADGETQKVKSIAIVDDSIVEEDETFLVMLANPTGGASLGATTSTTVTIIDNDIDSGSPGNGSDDSAYVNPNLSYLPVFPWAVGHGTETKAGRGGKIIKVTNLNDSGTGSLRAAIDASGPRIIVFEVSGTIKLKTDLTIKNPYVTLAGQTAPSPGINLRGAGLRITGHNILVQHIRIRVGDDADGPSPANRDALQVLGPNAYNVVVDHVSGCWSVDETMSTWYALKDVTFSNNLLGEALHNSIHPKGPHGMGILLGDHAHNVTFVGNLLAHNRDRNPRIKGDVKAEIVNNVFYNGAAGNLSAIGGVYTPPGTVFLSYVGNLWIAGPNAYPTAKAISILAETPSGSKIYFSDNKAPGVVHSSTPFEVSTPPIWHESLVARPSSKVEAWVAANAGARPADRDAVDQRIVNEMLSRSGGIINTPGQVGGWPNLKVNTRPFNVPADPNADDNGDGYTNIENLLHKMAAEVEGRSSN